MKRQRYPAACAGLFALLAVLCAGPIAGQTVASQADLDRLTALETELESLEAEIRRLEDIKAIKRLQRAYGYYADKKLAAEIGALFADEATVELAGLGVYVGRRRITDFYAWVMGGELEHGQLHNHLILQGVVTLEPGATTARGRWRALIQIGEHGESAVWSEGPYENEYVKEDGVWKFSRVHWFQTFAAPYSPGWHRAPMPLAGPSADFPPDRPPTVHYESYPGAFLPPYHYPNPVSGRGTETSDE